MQASPVESFSYAVGFQQSVLCVMLD